MLWDEWRKQDAVYRGHQVKGPYPGSCTTGGDCPREVEGVQLMQYKSMYSCVCIRKTQERD